MIPAMMDISIGVKSALIVTTSVIFALAIWHGAMLNEEREFIKGKISFK
jgi:hypothetical protein